MSVVELLFELRNRGVNVNLENDRLKCKANSNALTYELREQIADKKTEIIAYLRKWHTSVERIPIVAAARLENIPLSHAQERLWFLDQLEPASAVYNIPGALRLIGELDTEAFTQSIQAIVHRHEALRTTFESQESQVRQVIKPHLALPITHLDLGTTLSEQREAELTRLIEIDATAPFDLAIGPLLRVCLIHLGEDNETKLPVHIVLFSLHHIIFDGWSEEILVREFVTLYEAYSQGQPSPLPELPIQYADYAVWERDWLQGEVLTQQLDYWTTQLAGAPEVLALPTDRSRPAVQSYRGASCRFTLPEALTAKLNRLSRTQGVTLFMTLLAGFQVLLSRHSGQRDICIGSPIANRNRLETEGLIGFFVNTLVLRTDLKDNPTVTGLLTRVRNTCLGAQAHQDIPFEKLVEVLQPVRDLGHSPLFQVMFVLQNTPTHDWTLPGLRIESVVSETETAKFDLTLNVTKDDTQLQASLEYATDLFDEVTVIRLAEHFERLLQGIVATPEARLSELPLLSDAERHQLLIEWNATETEYPKDRCLHQLFEAQVEQHPEAFAVVYEEQHLSYAELNARANQLAHHLRSLGVGPDVLVGICVDRSLEMIIGLLGILKAGGAYLPLDPAYPKERLSYMLDDAQPLVLLTQATLQETLPEHPTVLCLDTDWTSLARRSKKNLTTQTTPLNLAYVIYTSGSTGRPKGVQITHGNAVQSTWARLGYYRECVGCFLLLSSFAFDSSVAGIFWTLSQGGCLLLPNEEGLRDPALIARKILERGVTHLLCLPSFFQLLLELDGSWFDSLRAVIVAGEACLPGLVNRHYEVAPQGTLFNEYGPTEGTVWSSVYRCPQGSAVAAIPIGKPISNVEIYVLDAYGNVVPANVPGELYIGGAGLARGYLNCPDLTAERFFPNPFNNHFGERLYRTGDLARYKSDGNIEFLGRIDHQVKIRGYRIELGEIEAALGRHPQVKDALVLVREDTNGEKRLVGYVVGRDKDTGSVIDELRAHLLETLPEYMVPSAYVILEALPLTPNGKVDRKVLLSADASVQLAQRYVAPRNPTEETLARLSADILGVDRVGIYDDFFNLGGHSILAAKLVLKARGMFNVDLPLRCFFDRPTVAMLAELIERNEVFDSAHDLNIVDFEAEAALDSTIQVAGGQLSLQGEPAEIFLTGATGFLGAFLLYEVLHQTSANVHCLVRAGTYDEARDRLRSTLERYDIGDPSLMHRVRPLCGDLSRPWLGLPQSQFQALAEQIDVIYHNGAVVNFVQPYATLKPSNVLGTREVLRLAAMHKVKPVHYVSTLSVFGNEAPFGTFGFSEDDFPTSTADFDDGYAQSKWVAERMVQNAAAREFPVSIYRLATIGGHSHTGACNTDDFFCRLIKGCIQIGKAPAEEYRFDVVPVDYASKAIIGLSRQPRLIGQVFHLASPHLMHSDVLIDLCTSAGYPITRVPYAEWLKDVYQEATRSSEHALLPLLPMFKEENTKEQKGGFNPHLQRYDCRKTADALASIDCNFMFTNATLLEVYFSYFLRSGFLVPPQGELTEREKYNGHHLG